MWEADLNYEFLKQLSELETRRMYQYCPDMKPEAHKYEVKTRRPRNSENIKINTLRRVRETELHQEAMKVSRIKCKEFADLFVKCSQMNPRKEVSKCQNEFLTMKKCMKEECDVEMDKRRRDMTRNKEWW